MNCPKLIVLTLAAMSFTNCQSSEAASFLFGVGQIRNTITGLASAELESEGVKIFLQAGPSGSRFDDSDAQGLGINSINSPAGITDPDRTKLNFIAGHPSGTPVAESFAFSFNRPGILKDLLFDGVKDETLEYFSLEFPDGHVITMFDSEADFRLGIQGFSLTDLNVSHPIEFQTEDDDLTGIGYSFAAGEVFTFTYGEGSYDDVPGYRTNPNFPQFPNAVGDGARFQGVVVQIIPEPTIGLVMVAAFSACLWLGKR